MHDCLKAGCQIPENADWETDLTGTEYFITPKGQTQLEAKDMLKSRGLASPDLADALSMTFAVRIAEPYRPVVSTPMYSPGENMQSWMR